MKATSLVILCGTLAGILVASGLTGCTSPRTSTGESNAAISSKKVKKVNFLFVQSEGILS